MVDVSDLPDRRLEELGQEPDVDPSRARRELRKRQRRREAEAEKEAAASGESWSDRKERLRQEAIEALCDDCLERLVEYSETRVSEQRQRIGAEIKECCEMPTAPGSQWQLQDQAARAEDVLEQREQELKEEQRRQEAARRRRAQAAQQARADGGQRHRRRRARAQQRSRADRGHTGRITIAGRTITTRQLIVLVVVALLLFGDVELE